MKNNYGKMHKQGFNQWRLQNKLRGRNTSAMQDLQTYLPQKKYVPRLTLQPVEGLSAWWNEGQSETLFFIRN